jgi:threonine dehydratase
MAQGVAWMARQLGVPATIVVPDNASQAKLAAVERMGGRIVRVPWERWWAAVESGSTKEAAEDIDGFFVHPVRDEAVMAGNGTIGLELVRQLESFDTVLIPWGGGGLTTGIASALHALRPEARIVVCEPETGAPVKAAIDGDGVPAPVAFAPSFIDGAGSGSLLAEMWERAGPLISDAFVVSLEATAATIRLLLERERIVAEGAAALPVAVALDGRAGGGRVVCIVSGGNIDARRLSEILVGRVPD